jgi:DNA polymerase
VVALGATALHAIIGRKTSIISLRGTLQPLDNQSHLVATIHPSYLLRMPDRHAAEREFDQFARDLRMAFDKVSWKYETTGIVARPDRS